MKRRIFKSRSAKAVLIFCIHQTRNFPFINRTVFVESKIKGKRLLTKKSLANTKGEVNWDEEFRMLVNLKQNKTKAKNSKSQAKDEYNPMYLRFKLLVDKEQKGRKLFGRKSKKHLELGKVYVNISTALTLENKPVLKILKFSQKNPIFIEGFDGNEKKKKYKKKMKKKQNKTRTSVLHKFITIKDSEQWISPSLIVSYRVLLGNNPDDLNSLLDNLLIQRKLENIELLENRSEASTSTESSNGSSSASGDEIDKKKEKEKINWDSESAISSTSSVSLKKKHKTDLRLKEFIPSGSSSKGESNLSNLTLTYTDEDSGSENQEENGDGNTSSSSSGSESSNKEIEKNYKNKINIIKKDQGQVQEQEQEQDPLLNESTDLIIDNLLKELINGITNNERKVNFDQAKNNIIKIFDNEDRIELKEKIQKLGYLIQEYNSKKFSKNIIEKRKIIKKRQDKLELRLMELKSLNQYLNQSKVLKQIKLFFESVFLFAPITYSNGTPHSGCLLFKGFLYWCTSALEENPKTNQRGKERRTEKERRNEKEEKKTIQLLFCNEFIKIIQLLHNIHSNDLSQLFWILSNLTFFIKMINSYPGILLGDEINENDRLKKNDSNIEKRRELNNKIGHGLDFGNEGNSEEENDDDDEGIIKNKSHFKINDYNICKEFSFNLKEYYFETIKIIIKNLRSLIIPNVENMFIQNKKFLYNQAKDPFENENNEEKKKKKKTIGINHRRAILKAIFQKFGFMFQSIIYLLKYKILF
ncbi:ribonucleic acid binding protein s1 [Anaeramoeba flamelloides]|uniref:Ribonucleic acid binding protein s1 n=1 Tax=Anaeramoeba flamelloides TaxID=1746091 RepID=A0AAV7Y7K5_9EUKA|nr:ribonucleic acid binding protein s1 [Anaeramoeba flamelloides]